MVLVWGKNSYILLDSFPVNRLRRNKAENTTASVASCLEGSMRHFSVRNHPKFNVLDRLDN